MNPTKAEIFISELDSLAHPTIELIATWIRSEDNSGDLRVPLFAMSKVTAMHIQAMAIGLDLDDLGKEQVIQIFMGSLTAALEDLDGFDKSEMIINKMMGKP